MSERESENQSNGGTAMVPASPPPAAPARFTTVRASRWGIATDVVVKTTGDLPEAQASELRWLNQFGASGNYSPSEVGAMIRKPNGEGYSADSIRAALTGRRTEQGSSLEPICESIRAFRRRQEETAANRTTAFIETRVSRRIWGVCERSRRKRRMAFIFGPTQVGKTAILDEYARVHNHGSTVFVRMPTRGALNQFCGELAAALRLPGKMREHEARRRIMDSFDENTLLVVDEAHQCLLGRSDTGGLTLEFLRELHDRRHCGVVICGTEVLSASLKNSPVLRQLWQRRSPALVVHLGRESYDHAELAEFARTFGLDPAPDREIGIGYTTDDAGGEQTTHRVRENPFLLQRRIVTEDSLGAWCKILEDAKDLAEADGGRMSWGRVITAWCLGLGSQATAGATGGAK